MSLKIKTHHLESIISDFDRLIKNLEIIIKEIRPRTTVKNTRIGQIRRDLDKLLELETPKVTKLLEIVTKLNQLNIIFDNGIDFNKEDAIRIIEGKYDLINDEKVQSHDFVFEFSMGARFALAYGRSKEISLSGQGDITIGGEIAVECKNIRSLNNLTKNVGKAKSQIEERVTNDQVKFGLIALDLSNVYPIDRVQEFYQRIFEDLHGNHVKIKEFQHFDQPAVDSTLEDRNFQKITQSYIAHQLEIALYSALPLRFDMGEKTLAIIYQVCRCFVIERSDLYIPTPIRSTGYILNNRLSGEFSKNAKEFIHGIAVGF